MSWCRPSLSPRRHRRQQALLRTGPRHRQARSNAAPCDVLGLCRRQARGRCGSCGSTCAGAPHSPDGSLALEVRRVNSFSMQRSPTISWCNSQVLHAVHGSRARMHNDRAAGAGPVPGLASGRGCVSPRRDRRAAGAGTAPYSSPRRPPRPPASAPAMTRPPPEPPSGPRSMTQSAVLMTSRLCSMTITVLPCSTSPARRAACGRPRSAGRVVGSSST